VRVTRDGAADLPDDLSARYSQQPLLEDQGEDVAAEVTLYREIRLALGPTVNAKTLGPLFESRPYSELRIMSEGCDVSRSGPLDPGHLHEFDKNANAVRLDEAWHRVTPLADIESASNDPETISKVLQGNHVDDPVYWDQTPLGENKQCFENHYLSWTPVDAAHVAHWLDRIEPQSHPIEFLPEVPNTKPARETWYPRPYLGNLVETAIGEGRLEAALRSEVERIRTAFEKHETEWRTHMQEQTAEQVAKFNSDLTATAIPQSQPTDDSYDQNT
jgi:hypothetical protein